MTRLFLSLYVFLAIALIGLSAVLEPLFFDDTQSSNPQIETIAEILSTHQTQTDDLPSLLTVSGTPYHIFNIDDIAWREEDNKILAQRKPLILYEEEGNALIYLQLNTTQIIEVEIARAVPKQGTLLIYSAVFYLLLGLIIFIWVRPLWKDLDYLKSIAENVQPDGSLAKAEVSKNSLIFSIASAINSMSEKVRLLIRSQQELTGAVAHEFRTPLARLKFALALQSEQGPQTLAMQDDVKELEKLVEEMLGYTSIDAQVPEMNITDIPLQQLCETRIAHIPESMKSNTSVQFQPSTKEVSEHSITISADSHFIERALDNLLLNACRHAHSRVIVQIKEEKDHYQIHVEDDGEGVDITLREKVFEPFYRPDQSRNRHRGGAGLGLAIVKRIMEWHKGACFVASSSLGGACFVLSLPKRVTTAR
ncbi:ATP-binding protein [Aestuariibacter sp. AA17]|uniref:histidine kinase n=1 Tax=Fluctibacter corallii TaxID=2984329 RepID=A0ABT3A7W4_9ALTE|nr:ATP-binding protein [Aestuariibacter sp. AA17]MCV2884781.1 ATP-binding protein [Aestuariibacter sp. AA17]